MELIRKFKNTNVSVFFGVLVTLSFFVFIPRVCHADISTDAYCQLTIQSMQGEVSNLQELISLADRYGDDPVAFAQQEAQKQREFEQQKAQLFSSFGATAEEYVMYMDTNSEKVNAYLTDHPDVRQQIDDLSDQVNSLLEQFEAKKAAIKKSYEPQLPLK